MHLRMSTLSAAYAKIELHEIFNSQGINQLSTSRFQHLKVASLAQWLLESGRGTSKLAELHNNFGGLKWRAEMEGFAKPAMFQAHDGEEEYCEFASPEAFITGYWKFLTRAPYKGWTEHTMTPESFIGFIGPIYSTDPNYLAKVKSLFAEARQLLNAEAGAAPAERLVVDVSPSKAVKTQQEFTIAGKGPATLAGTPVHVLIDTFPRPGGVVAPDGSFKFSLKCQNAGSRKVFITIGDLKAEVPVRVIPEGEPVAVEATGFGRAFPLKGSVGRGGANHAADVQVIKSRLHELGFSWVDPAKGMDNGTIHAIHLYQSIIDGDARLRGDGRIDPNGPTHKFLQAANSPRWQAMPVKGTGFINFEASDKSDHHDFGTDWLATFLTRAAADYQKTYRGDHPKATMMAFNDVSLPQGGDTPDHSGHETGLCCDALLPRKDGDFGNVTFRSAMYDQAATRAMLKSFRRQPNFSVAFFNDPVLIGEGLCIHAAAHDDHMHVEVRPPAPMAASASSPTPAPAAEVGPNPVLASSVGSRLVPNDWLQRCAMQRVICHWTAGAHRASEDDKDHYHILIEHDGKVVRGTNDIQDNVSTADDVYAAHTFKLNTGSIGVSVCCMAGAQESPFNPGRFPMTKVQWETMAQVVAELCAFYKIPVTEKTVLGHFEVSNFHGIDQGGKWDPGILPWDPGMSKTRVGQMFRALVSQALSGAGPVDDASPKVRLKVKGKLLEGMLTNGSTHVMSRLVEKELGFKIESGTARDTTFIIDGKSHKLPHLLVDGHGFVMVRDLAEAMGMEANWDRVSRTAEIAPIKELPVTVP